MYSTLLTIHSYLRYLVLALLIIVTIMSLIGWLSRKNYGQADNKFSLFLLIGTHLQLLAGLLLYFVSPYVKFGSDTMKDASLRYWTVEHALMMLIAVALVTVARISSKKKEDSPERHKPMFLLNAIALALILIAIVMSKRGIL